MSLTLSEDELRELTHKKRGADQAQWLEHHGVPHRKDGLRKDRLRIIVSRAAVEGWLAGKEQPRVRGVDLSLVR